MIFYSYRHAINDSSFVSKPQGAAEFQISLARAMECVSCPATEYEVIQSYLNKDQEALRVFESMLISTTTIGKLPYYVPSLI